jgi:hypothetical protein
MRALALVVGIIGILAIAAGIVYFTVPAHSLPSFMGTVAHSHNHRTKRGTVAVIVGVVLLVVAVGMAIVDRRSRAHS